MKKIFTLLLIFAANLAVASTQAEIASLQSELTALVEKAQKKGINTLKEQTSLRTAEIFLGYADWDEKNVAANIEKFKKVTAYKKEAEKYANLLPEFERSEIKAMLSDGIEELKGVMAGKIRRLDTPQVDWSKCSVEGDQITFEGKPVFLADWTWKPKIDKYCEFHGELDGYFLTPAHVINDKGDVSPKVLSDLKSKESGSLGFVFLNHSNVPKWAVAADPKIKEGAGIKYTMYDVNNPLARKIQSDLLAKVVPMAAGKKYSELGYMLCNEPHWNLIDKEWAASPFSDYAVELFRGWLKDRHGNIKTLNAIWGTKAKSFEELELPKILQRSEFGSPKWHDMTLFNMERINEWFSFLRGEVLKNDPNAKTHIKLIPNMWADNDRVHGMDIETLTRQSDIIGNDAASCGKWMWGPAHDWEERYTLDVLDLTMAYDFMKSVSPNKINVNSEGHMLSTGKTRNLYMDTRYVRCNFYLAHIQGMTLSQNWYWCRREDGSSRAEDDNGYAGSNNHQPRVVNAVHTTMLELNSVSDIIMGYQRQPKDLRVFMSNAGAINGERYMSDIFEAYEGLLFEGITPGFATSGMAEADGYDGWKVVLVANSPSVYRKDVEMLQGYLDAGGTVVLDAKSLKTDEYGRKLDVALKSSKGTLITVKDCKAGYTKSLEIAREKSLLPTISLSEKNQLGMKGCNWRVIENKDGSYDLFVTNLGKTTANISITLPGGKAPKLVEDTISGEKLGAKLTLEPTDMYLLKIK
ncbi:MAG: beta-galactosidase [Rikenellaceae bacterium]